MKYLEEPLWRPLASGYTLRAYEEDAIRGKHNHLDQVSELYR